ncbi:MAG: hypothetical protein D6808_02490, partial [Candidatus Dadabacteria bacterium]
MPGVIERLRESNGISLSRVKSASKHGDLRHHFKTNPESHYSTMAVLDLETGFNRLSESTLKKLSRYFTRSFTENQKRSLGKALCSHPSKEKNSLKVLIESLET